MGGHRRAWDDPIARLYAGVAVGLLALLALAFWSVGDAPVTPLRGARRARAEAAPLPS